MIDLAFEAAPVPPAKELCGSAGSEAWDETAAFADLPWPEVPADLVHSHYMALYFFTPEAFHYYLPAFLVVPLAAGDVHSLAVHNVVFTLQPTGDDAVMRFRRKRWKLLTKAEEAALGEWLEWMESQDTDEVTGEEIAAAAKAVRERFWWRT